MAVRAAVAEGQDRADREHAAGRAERVREQRRVDRASGFDAAEAAYLERNGVAREGGGDDGGV